MIAIIRFNRKLQQPILIVVILLLILYVLGIFRYQTRFVAGTYYSDIAIGGQTIDQAQSRISQQFGKYSVKITEHDQELGTVDLAHFQPQYISNEDLEQALAKQKIFLWPVALFNKKHVPIATSVQLNDEQVTAFVDQLPIDQSNRKSKRDAQLIEKDDGTFDVISEEYGEQVSSKSFKDALLNTFSNGKHQLALQDAYEQPQLKVDTPELENYKKQLQKVRQTPIELQVDGQVIQVPQDQIASWVYLDDQGHIAVHQEMIAEYLQSLNYQLAGVFHPYAFHSTYQGTVQVQPGTLGWYIDRFEESERLATELLNAEPIAHEPIIGGYGYGMHQQIGPDYVEVDLAHQMMLIYIGGELVLDTPIVSGITGANTIPGAYQVWQKLEKTNLTGYDEINKRNYVQPVNYWIAFDDQAQGIHDAGWQSTFGGTAYLTAGSLGCINTPPAIMGQVYEIVYAGMPVIIF